MSDDTNTHRWLVPPEAVELVGVGGPFEIRVEEVLDVPTQVFARRPAHARAVLGAASADAPELPYLVFPDRTLTFEDVAASVARVAAHLRELGVRPGDRVAVAAHNTPAHAIVWWATVSLGGVLASLNGWWTAAELEYGITLSEPRVVVVDEQRRQRLGPAVTGTARVVECDEFEQLIGPRRPFDPPLPDAAIAEDDAAIILFTSGTTGRPKGATISHRVLVHGPMVSALSAAVNLRAAIRAGIDPATPSPQGSTLLVAPLFHVSGAFPLVGAAINRARLVFMPAGRWDEVTHLQLTAEHRVRAWSGVPTQFWRLLEHPQFGDFDLASIQVVNGGGAPFPPELFRLVNSRLPHASVTVGYGTSETFGTGTRLSGTTLATHPASVGSVEPLCEVKIQGPGGDVLADGEIGEIHIRGPAIFLGYWNDPEASAAALDQRRWYATGDYGHFSDGVLYLESRMRDMIIRGGENIYPIEIENRLISHPAVAEACIVGVPHVQLGQEVVAVVVLHPGYQPEAGELRSWVGEHLAAFKVPRFVTFRDALPYNATGKVLKVVVEADVRAELEPFLIDN